MNNSVSSIQLTKISSSSSALQNGSNVFVRVLSQGKGGDYVVSFAGNKYTVFSQRQLQVGTAFRALVSIKDGKVFLSPQTMDNTNGVKKVPVNAADAVETVSGFLQELGLKSDSISIRIVQYFQSTGLHFNMKLASKARSIGLQFPGKEEEATEIALYLEHKGIMADVDSVIDILGVLYGDDTGERHRKNKHELFDEKNDEASAITDDEQNVDDENISFDFLESLYEAASDTLNKKTGLLTYLNHHCNNPLHWIILPFEKGSADSKISGNIRILLNLDKKLTEKMIFYVFFTGKICKIVVKYTNRGEFANKQGYSIEFCIDGNNSVQDKKRLEEMLETCLPSDIPFDISYSNELSSDAVFTLGSTISIVKLDA